MSFAVAVLMTKPPQAVVIRKSWIYKFSETKTLNNGANRNQTHSVFYSPFEERAADFSAPLKEIYQFYPDACYNAKIVRFFGK